MRLGRLWPRFTFIFEGERERSTRAKSVGVSRLGEQVKEPNLGQTVAETP